MGIPTENNKKQYSTLDSAWFAFCGLPVAMSGHPGWVTGRYPSFFAGV